MEKREYFEKLARANTRNSLEKALNKYRQEYAKALKLGEKLSAEKNKIDAAVASNLAQLTAAKQEIRRITDILQKMDLSGANEVRERGNGQVNFIKDKKEYHIEFDDQNDVKLIPWKEFKSSLKKQDENNCGDEEKPRELNLEDDPAKSAFMEVFNSLK